MYRGGSLIFNKKNVDTLKFSAADENISLCLFPFSVLILAEVVSFSSFHDTWKYPSFNSILEVARRNLFTFEYQSYHENYKCHQKMDIYPHYNQQN